MINGYSINNNTLNHMSFLETTPLIWWASSIVNPIVFTQHDNTTGHCTLEAYMWPRCVILSRIGPYQQSILTNWAYRIVIALTLLYVFELNDLRCLYIGICQLNMLANLYVYFQKSLMCLDTINAFKWDRSLLWFLFSGESSLAGRDGVAAAAGDPHPSCERSI